MAIWNIKYELTRTLREESMIKNSRQREQDVQSLKENSQGVGDITECDWKVIGEWGNSD